MAKTRILNLAKELKMDVKVLMQRLKDEMGLQVDNYLSSLDDVVAGRVRQAMSQAEPQVEEKRVGDNIKRRRRVAAHRCYAKRYTALRRATDTS